MVNNKNYFVYPDYFYNPYGYVFSGYTNNGGVSEQTGTIFIEESRANNQIYSESCNKKNKTTSKNTSSQKNKNSGNRKSVNENGYTGGYALNGKNLYVPAYPY